MARATLTKDGTLMFECPGCGDNHGVPVDGSRGWTWNGDLDKPTVSPSILVRSGHYADGVAAQNGECWCNYEERFGKPAPFKCYRCHSFVVNGRIEFTSDCTHEFAGRTVDLPEWR